MANTRRRRLVALAATVFFLVAAVAAASGAGPIPEPRAIPVAPVVREERMVVIDGVSEIWRLEWQSPPESVCGPEGGWEEWGMCPCAGFIFGEAGELDLVRLRPDAPQDRLHLTPLFKGFETPLPGALLRRWPERKGDADLAKKPGFAKAVRARQPVPIMELGDYDHDGRATEFVLQVGAGPCGHRQALLVGIDARNGRLHAFGTAEEPSRAIVLESPEAWARIRKASGAVEIDLWRCGDHGAEAQESVILRADGKGLHATRTQKACPE